VQEADVEAVARVLVEQAVAPLQRALREAEQRVAELERKLAQAHAATSPVAHSPPPILVPVAAPVSPAAASAPAVPVASVVPAVHRQVSMPAVVDIEALARDVPIDADIRAFNGGRRRRRMLFVFFFFVVLVFGGLFAMLALSYAPHN
jgi:hypothetical protein